MSLWTRMPGNATPTPLRIVPKPQYLDLTRPATQFLQSKISQSRMGMEPERPRIRFVGQPREAVAHVDNFSSPQSQEAHQRVEAVPALSYEIRSLGSVTTTMAGLVCRKLIEHCEESNLHGREVGGILVGYCSERIEPDQRMGLERGYEIVVTNSIPISSFDSSNVHLSFTEESWSRAEDEVRQKYAPEGKIRLGWYHTHPDQGIFFSSQDEVAHEIFAEPYQFALVVDPRSMEAGLFYRGLYPQPIMAGPICFRLTQRGK